MRRVLALLGATAMIVTALVVRAGIDDGDTSGGGDGETTIACATELADICEQWAHRADVTPVGQDVGYTIADLSDGRVEEGIDAWLAPATWVELARSQPEAPLGEPSRPIARSRVAIVVDRAQDRRVADACGDDVGWRCIADVERPSVALTDPESGNGLAVLGAAAVGYFRRADFASNDFDAAFDDWLRSFVDGTLIASGGRSPVDRLITEQGLLTAVGAVEVDARTAETRSERARLIYPAPVSAADVVLAPVRGRMDADVRDDLAAGRALRDAFTGARWQVDGISGTAGQPRGGVLAALLERWREIG
jgi:hypothetical protein